MSLLVLNFLESPATADQSLNSSKSSADTATGSLLISFSDEELDTERCNYCNGLLRLKRLENHPQYCSKKCRKLWKKNPTINEEQGLTSHRLNYVKETVRLISLTLLIVNWNT